MAIKAVPTVSEKILLGDINERVAALEGDCAPDERAWVIVRQATEGDAMQRSAWRSNYTLRWTGDGATEEVRDTNQRELWALEVYMTLCDVGNIYRDPEGKVALFQFEDTDSYRKLSGGFEEFKNRYNMLPTSVAVAILRAVYSLNPDWSWMPALPGTEGEA